MDQVELAAAQFALLPLVKWLEQDSAPAAQLAALRQAASFPLAADSAALRLMAGRLSARHTSAPSPALLSREN